MNNQMPEQTRKFLEQVAGFPALHLMTPEEMRKVVVATIISDKVVLTSTEDVELEGPHGELTVRIYRPYEDRNIPVIVFYHGGGFVFNRMEHYDPMCSKLAAETGHAVVSVDYRLAPEHKFPVPVDEAIYAAQWVYDNAEKLGFDSSRISVMGESVGGTLAAVVAQQAAERGAFSIAYQILLAPLTDWTQDYESKRTYGSGYFLETALLNCCANHYFNSEDEKNSPLASPLLGNVEGVAPAFVVTGEYDPVRDEGEQYAQKLVKNGIPVTQKRYLGMIHLFYAMTDVFEDGHDVYRRINEELSKQQ